MIVGIDYTAAAWQGAGIGRYTRELVRATVAQSTQFRFVLFFAARGIPSQSSYLADLRQLCAAFPHVRAVPIALSPRLLTILWQRLRLPLPVEIFTGHLDLLHAPDFVLPPTRARTLLTVHDLTFLVHPECFEPSLQRYLARVAPRSLRRADLILADSQSTGADLMRMLDVAPERIAVVYPGVAPQFHPLPASQIEPVRQRLGLPAEFLLFVSTIEPRKNLVRLLEAFSTIASPTQLVIAGRKGWLYEEIFTTLERLQLQSRVRFLDYVADSDLPALYNLARAFVYPSLYEGFGLPVVEALACGVPVVTTRVASLPEIAGAAAILVEPFDSAAIAEGITVALSGAEQLRQAGPIQAQQFTWDRSAHALLTQYERVLS
ncbi:MAG: glycosyltransferase family 4 protein [Chloroflexales bacterium]|nr:glycosyltransferase family 4 protein [Chloroflexales bacterium]